jgi:hypothetical protein
VSWRQSFREEFRRQTSAEIESPPIARVRGYAAVLSIVFGIIGLGGLFSLAVGNISGVQGIGLFFLIAGGVLGALVLMNRDVTTARRFGLWAAACTLTGLLGFFLITVLTS